MDDKNFRNLKVWQLGMQLAEEAYRLSHEFPKHEMYGLIPSAAYARNQTAIDGRGFMY